MIVDKDYYKETYKGEDIENFDKLNKASQSLIEYITLKSEGQLKASRFLDKVKEAICQEIDFLNSQGGTEALQNNSENYKSETIGRHSYTKSEGSEVKYVNGIPLSSMVEVVLLPTGLLYRGL